MRLAVLVVSATLIAQSAVPTDQQIENVEAFARLYGAVRYFYPSDASAALDWNRFAVYGTGHVRRAVDAADLQRSLDALFAPLGPGILLAPRLPPAPAIGPANSSLVAWQYDGPGGMGSGDGPYRSGRLNRAGPPRSDSFVAMMQSVAAAEHRSKRVRLTARARVATPGEMGWAGLWLRVDRPSQQVGFFDNMQDRPIRSTDWQEYTIEGMVADDATAIVLGPLASGALTAEYDAFELATLTDGTWIAVAIENAGFEEVSGALPPGWQRVGNAASPSIVVETNGAARGERFLSLTASPGSSSPAPTGAAPENAHVDIELRPGLSARVRLSLSDEDARTTMPSFERLKEELASMPTPAGTSDIDVRLADVVVAWNVLRHFYPYWKEAGVDWDTRLRGQLELAAAARDRRGHHDALRTVVADARDGHANVIDTAGPARRGLLPVQIAVIDGQFVVTASDAPGDAPIGSVVTAIGHRAASEVFQEEMRLSSGSVQWREFSAVRSMVRCEHGATVAIGLQSPDGPARAVSLPCTASQLVAEPRPAAIAEVEKGYWYVDLTRATGTDVTAALQSLAGARGIVFDVRGYPTDAGFAILPHLIDVAENGQWMHVPHITGPFGHVERWDSAGWNLQPAAPHLGARRVFVTDGRAISYAESVMGYVAGRKLGTIVGAPTAGTNGNVASTDVPGGFTVAFTGMRVTGHDGRRAFHLVGVVPDVAVQPTLAGIRARRDEVLERAFEVLGVRSVPR